MPATRCSWPGRDTLLEIGSPVSPSDIVLNGSRSMHGSAQLSIYHHAGRDDNGVSVTGYGNKLALGAAADLVRDITCPGRMAGISVARCCNCGVVPAHPRLTYMTFTEVPDL